MFVALSQNVLLYRACGAIMCLCHLAEPPTQPNIDSSPLHNSKTTSCQNNKSTCSNSQAYEIIMMIQPISKPTTLPQFTHSTIVGMISIYRGHYRMVTVMISAIYIAHIK